jgi:hypothetical protein
MTYYYDEEDNDDIIEEIDRIEDIDDLDDLVTDMDETDSEDIDIDITAQVLDSDDLAIIAELSAEPIPDPDALPTKRKKNYLNNADMLVQLKISLHDGKMSDTFTHMMMMLTDRYGSLARFAGYTYIDDMKAYALLMVVRTWFKFDPKKSSNPFAFFTQCIKHSFYQYLNKEKRQRNIRDEKLIYSGMNPSNTYMSNYEHTVTSGRMAGEGDSYDGGGGFGGGDGPINGFE